MKISSVISQSRFVLAALTIFSLLLSALPAQFFIAEAAPSPQVTVNVVPNPAGSDDEGEYFELVYSGTGDLNVENFTVSDKDGLIYTFPNQTLSDGVSWKVCTNVTTLTDCDDDWGSENEFVNSGDSFVLKDDLDVELLNFVFGQSGDDEVQSDSFKVVGKVTVCHSTGSQANPYVSQQPSKTADVGGHDGHDGPVWFAGITEAWGDIIPPFDYDGGSYPGKNWTTEGQAIYNNNCDIPASAPTASITVVKEVVGQGPLQLSEFDLGVNDNVYTSGEVVSVDVKTNGATNVVVSEVNIPSDYTLTSISCEGSNQTFATTTATELEFPVFADDAYTCTFTNEYVPPVIPDSFTLIGQKVVCTDEADIPNKEDWDSLRPITANTAADWVAQHASCELVLDWDYEWVTVADANDPGDTLTGPAGNGWNTFTNQVEIPFAAAKNTNTIWVREVLLPDYIPFTHDATNPAGNTDDYTAGFYCNTDVRNYDNYERLDGIQVDGTYYCVAWNHIIAPPAPKQCSVSLISDGSTLVIEKNNEPAVELVDPYIAGTWTTELMPAKWIWGDAFVTDPFAQETQTFLKQFGWIGDVDAATLTVASDNAHTVEMNGSFVGQDSSQNNFSDATYDTYDVTALVAQGNNELRIGVTNYEPTWNPANVNPESNPAGLKYRLDIEGFVTDGDDCSIPYEPPAIEVGPYCGDGLVNQGWEQCDGGADCTDYCLADNQCHDEQLVKITLDEQAPASVSFDGKIYLGDDQTVIPNGTWFNLSEVGDQSVYDTAIAETGLAVQRDGDQLLLAVQGGNSRNSLDYVFGTIETKGIGIGAIDRSTVPGWQLEDSGTYEDIVDKNGNDIDFKWYLTTGDDAMGVEMTRLGVPYDCSECRQEVRARVVLQDGESVTNGGAGDLSETVVLGDGSEVLFGEWFTIFDGTSFVSDTEPVESMAAAYSRTDGLFVSRQGDGTVKVLLHGYHSPGGDTNYESLRAMLEFDTVTVDPGTLSDLPIDPLEDHSEVDGVISNDNFDRVAVTGDQSGVEFDLWVDTAADGFKLRVAYDDIPYCEEPREPMQCSLTATPDNPEEGKPFTLDWDVSHADLITIDNGIGSVAATGSEVLQLTQDTTYTLIAQQLDDSDDVVSEISCDVFVDVDPNGGGGGGGLTLVNQDDSEPLDVESGSQELPPGEVLGEQVSVVPTGAPNAGAGGMAPSTPVSNGQTHSVIGLLFAAVRVRPEVRNETY